jgi:hypothetical protein
MNFTPRVINPSTKETGFIFLCFLSAARRYRVLSESRSRLVGTRKLSVPVCWWAASTDDIFEAALHCCRLCIDPLWWPPNQLFGESFRRATDHEGAGCEVKDEQSRLYSTARGDQSQLAVWCKRKLVGLPTRFVSYTTGGSCVRYSSRIVVHDLSPEYHWKTFCCSCAYMQRWANLQLLRY